jgi:hypothetical protein
MLKGIYVLSKESYDQIYGPEERGDIAKLADVCAPAQAEPL